MRVTRLYPVSPPAICISFCGFVHVEVGSHRRVYRSINDKASWLGTADTKHCLCKGQSIGGRKPPVPRPRICSPQLACMFTTTSSQEVWIPAMRGQPSPHTILPVATRLQRLAACTMPTCNIALASLSLRPLPPPSMLAEGGGYLSGFLQ